ncbi:MAG TPA: hypothetical protein VFJ94_02885 [Intrasporangium sp.]|uniref:hypothetical protein n=1 Tax=Intrasporangium sp. TaxID=1925024 RepID=UPI002D775111|nr:hypothetical protein [Intrasporangium sp.]HET7397444.1 hypothetical protein [Intrasporangium sp.]
MQRGLRNRRGVRGGRSPWRRPSLRRPSLRRPPLRRPPLLVLVALLVQGACAPGTTLGAPRTGSAVASAGPQVAAAHRVAAPGATTASRLEAAAGRLIARRWQAAAAADLAGWLQGVRGDRLREQQRELFARLEAVRIADPQLVSLTTQPAAAGLAAAASWTGRAVLAYRLAGFDRAPRTFTLDLAFSSDAAFGVTIVGSAPADRPEPWDLPGLKVRRSPRALVLGQGGDEHVDELARRADAAAVRVHDVVGTVVPAVWVAPGTPADAARLLGRDASSLVGLAAVTDGPLRPDGRAGSDRVVVVPTAWASLTGAGRDVVLTHELTHVTVRTTATRPAPLWLSEGLAEYVAYRDVRLPDRQLAAPVLAAAQVGGVPARLPDDHAFDAADGRLAAAYGQAWLAVRTLVDAHGEAAVLRFYRAVAAADHPPPGWPADPEAAADRALRDVLHTSRPELTRAWRARITGLPGP